jgi:hypothetical protein
MNGLPYFYGHFRYLLRHTGDQFDATKLEGLTTRAVIVLPGNTSHFPWAKSSEYISQIMAIGPLGLKIRQLEGRPTH